MQYKKSDKVEQLPLSVRTLNALKRSGITTVQQFIQFPNEEFKNIKNIGMKSVNEFLFLKKRLVVPADFSASGQGGADDSDDDSMIIELDTMPTDKILSPDDPITILPLTIRTHRVLEENGVHTIGDLIAYPAENFIQLRGMGVKSSEEAIRWQKSLFRNGETVTLKKDSCLEDVLDSETLKILKNIYGAEGIPENVYREVAELAHNHPDLQGESLLQGIFALPLLREHLRDSLQKILEKADEPQPLNSIMAQFPESLNRVSVVFAVRDVLAGMEDDGLIIHRGQGYEIKKMTVLEYANRITNENHRDLFLLRLHGETLEMAGSKKNLTRERVRQIVVKLLQRRPPLVEDKYIYLFETYNFSKEDFRLAFEEPETTFNYLDMLVSHRGTGNLLDILDDPAVPVPMKRQAERAIFKDYISVNGVYIHRDRLSMFRYVLSHYCFELTTYDQFRDTYNRVIGELGLANDEKLSISSKNYVNYIRESDLALAHTRSSFRYYNIAERDYGPLLEELPLKQFNNVEMSTKKFFHDFPELMQRYDIRDEYELHNLLKKVMPDDFVPHVTFHRMPTIEFGKGNLERQLMDLLLEYGEITVVDLAARYEELYGVAAPTAMADKFKFISSYYDHGKYSVKYLTLTEEQKAVLKKAMTEDIYSNSEIREIFREHYPDLSDDHINAFSLRSLGFKPYSTYAIRDSYNSALEFFDHLLLDSDYVDLDQFEPFVTRLIAFSSELNVLKNDLQIIEMSPRHYINIRLLQRLGYGKEDLIAFSKAVCDFLQPGTYFTIHSLRKRGFTKVIGNVGFSDWFYASLLATQKDDFEYQRLCNSKLFFYGKEDVTISKFLTYILKEYQSISMSGLMKLLEEEYDLPIPKYKLMSGINASDLFYDAVDQVIYRSFDDYSKAGISKH